MNKILVNILNSRIIKLRTLLISLHDEITSHSIAIYLIIQFIRGIILSMHYCPNITLAFSSIIHITRNVNNT